MLHPTTAHVAVAVLSLGVLGVPTLTAAMSPRVGAESPALTARAVDIVPAVGRAALSAHLCGPEPTGAQGWQSLFDRLTGTWSGGDGASSTRLPDGRLLWLFGDTFVGRVMANGARAAGTRLVRNSVVLTEGSCATPMPTVRDVLPGRDGTWLWPTHAVVTTAGDEGEASDVAVFAQRVRRTGPGSFGFERVGASVVMVTVPWNGIPSVGRVIDLADSSVLWGAALAQDGGYTLIYGTRPSSDTGVFGRDLLLARAPTPTVLDQSTWSYRTRDGWSREPEHADVVRAARQGVSTVLSVRGVPGGWLAVTKPQEFLDDRVVLLRAGFPWGPWDEVASLHQASTRSVPRYSPAFVAGTPSTTPTVIVVSRSATRLSLALRDASVSRPIFLDVPRS